MRLTHLADYAVVMMTAAARRGVDVRLSATELGAKYDDRGFHDTILLAGSMPLGMLETRVDAWIAKQR
ncbi:MAG TPA: hypothetical protein VM915_00530 [Verrucomicrobiae bacterium]|nr:hypothetical protein [Verrucomicrobiae bacterium]